jgi:hypothetical protein
VNIGEDRPSRSGEELLLNLVRNILTWHYASEVDERLMELFLRVLLCVRVFAIKLQIAEVRPLPAG